MFKAQISDIRLLRDSLDAVSELIDEAELMIFSDGIRLIASDRAVVAVINFFIRSSAFEKYEFEKDMKMGVNLTSFMQILKRSKDETMSIEVDGNKIIIGFQGKSKRQFTLPIIEIAKEETPDLTKLESGFTTSLTINSQLISDGIDDSELAGDSAVFTVRKDMLIINSENDSSSIKLEIPPGDIMTVEKVVEPVRARYSIDYMKKMLKARKLSDTAKMALSSEYPLKLSFTVPGKMDLSFILAPRVEDN